MGSKTNARRGSKLNIINPTDSRPTRGLISLFNENLEVGEGTEGPALSQV